MKRPGFAALAAGALLGAALSASAAPGPTVRLAAGPRTATAGAAWTGMLVVRPASAGRPTVRTTGPAPARTGSVRRFGRGRYRVWLVLPVAGTWRLEARVAKRLFSLGSLRVRAPAPRLTNVADVAVAPDGSLLAADLSNRVLRVDPASGRVTLVAGDGRNAQAGDTGPAARAAVGFPVEVAADPRGGVAIVAGEARIRHVDGAGVIRTVAGIADSGCSGDGGPATAAALDQPTAAAYDTAGNLYIAELGGRIRRVDAATGLIRTIAGVGGEGYAGDGGPAVAARLNRPHGLAVGADGALVFADTFNHRVRRLSPDGTITTLAGTGVAGGAGDGGPGTAAQLSLPVDVAVASDGSVLVADHGNTRIRRIDVNGAITTAVVAEGPNGVAVDPAGVVYFNERDRARIRRFDPRTGALTTVAGR